MRISDPACVIHRADQMEPKGYQEGLASGSYLGRLYTCRATCRTTLLRIGELPGQPVGEVSLLFHPWDRWARLEGGRLYIKRCGRRQLRQWRWLPAHALTYIERVQRRALYLLARRGERGVVHEALVQLLVRQPPAGAPMRRAVAPAMSANIEAPAWGDLR